MLTLRQRTFGPLYPDASSLADAFLEASQRLLETEKSNDTALNVASLMILGISTICFGKDALAKTLTAAGVQMAERLGLMGDGRLTREQFQSRSREERSMMTFAAWGAFNFSS